MGKKYGMKFWATAMAMFLAVALVGACSTKNANNGNTPATVKPENSSVTAPQEETANATEEHVTLTWYFPGNVQKMTDKATVEAEMNKILNEKINASIELMPIDWGAYDQKMNIMSAGGEAFDLMFTAPWSNDYYKNAAKGALLPLNDLLDQYAPNLKSVVPEKVWEATKIKGNIYGAINWQIVAMPYGAQIAKKYVDKYDIDVASLKTFKDFEPYYEKWDEDYPAFFGGDQFTNAPPYYGFDSVGGDNSVGWVKLDDPNLTVVNQYASDEFRNIVETYYSWREKGFIPRDAAMNTDERKAALNNAGQFELPGTFSLPLKPGSDLETKAAYGEEFVNITITEPLITTNRAIATMTGISRTSKNPERAAMFLDLMSSDKELYRLMASGVEGKHYTKISENLIEYIADSSYQPNSDWMFGNQFLGYYTTPEAAEADIWAVTEKLNNEAKASPLLGFVFDAEPVKSELAQLDSVYSEYSKGLLTGTMNPADKLPEFLDKLNRAGADKVIAEKQRQIDEWKKSK
ncbi:sugar ABC transporter substrate-binding protein [Paenibacillus agaridevorans]|uniref:Sugar ABC transporter substrate-binding protein n=1 Tax=Paenibacillus agaridevorans TaxID=171404 RepID=A0A2R5EV92_9BACL|nr:ABC transporter substrate-binding protein [Paenibacillus agaridevorans]GBG08958.1 sugar ABC transporter substrate-binding protein [Paenibacillus agaridevorans]